MTMGERVKKLREEKNLTQMELAEKIHVGRDTINKWEGGRDINSTYLAALADFFNVSCDYIVRGISYENTDAIERTGLSDDAVATLHSFIEFKHPDFTWFADVICRNCTFLINGSEAFSSYLVKVQEGIMKQILESSRTEILECYNAAEYQKYKCIKAFEQFFCFEGDKIKNHYYDYVDHLIREQKQRKE